MRITLTDVESSQLSQIGHDAATNTLAVRFKPRKSTPDQPGSLYHYSNFTPDDFEAFSKAESLGSHFGKVIKNAPEKFPFTKIDETGDDVAVAA